MFHIIGLSLFMRKKRQFYLLACFFFWLKQSSQASKKYCIIPQTGSLVNILKQQGVNLNLSYLLMQPNDTWEMGDIFNFRK